MNLYTRQHDMNLEVPDTVTVIGVGGIGSWTALDLALAGVEKLYVVDFDEIEEHNLNRTPFKTSQIGMQKTAAVVELIQERRMDAEVIPVNKRIEDTAGVIREDMEESVVIDCRDHASPLPDGISESVALTAGYDGFEYTMHLNPNYEAIFGEEETEYETVPSFIAPPQVLSGMITAIVCSPEVGHDNQSVVSGDLRELIDSKMINRGDE